MVSLRIGLPSSDTVPLVEHTDKQELKVKYGLEGKKVLSTFGLLSSGKSIETTLARSPDR
jgi:hypothetical protein